ncbi:hypothetical protein ACLK2H_12535 [Escherichia coli]
MFSTATSNIRLPDSGSGRAEPYRRQQKTGISPAHRVDDPSPHGSERQEIFLALTLQLKRLRQFHTFRQKYP